jgi:hypothetical protein
MRMGLFNRLDWTGLYTVDWELEIGDWLSGFGSCVTLHDLNGAPARDFVFSSLLAPQRGGNKTRRLEPGSDVQYAALHCTSLYVNR